MKKNICYAQSGGPTAVINESARAVIETARQYSDTFGNIYAGLNGITGILQENLIDTSLESKEAIQALQHTPAAAFRSCRHKLKDISTHKEQYARLIEVFDAHDISYFLYNGGGDSQDTANKISQICTKLGYDIQCIGIPKTIDNDLAFTDCSPGFASAAKYLATSIREASIDLASMANSSTKVFILEVMGRHAGWLAAAAGLAREKDDYAPHLIIFPEVAFDAQNFLYQVEQCVKKYGLCTIVVSEGARTADGSFLSESTTVKDSFGHSQLGGVAPVIANLVKTELNLKYHYAIADYLQRAARHVASKTDLQHAYAVGKAAIDYAIEGENAIMTTIIRDSNNPYQWHTDKAPLAEIANVEKKMPSDFISESGFHITDTAREYLSPLIQGECFPPFVNGMPDYVRLKNQLVEKKLKATEVI